MIYLPDLLLLSAACSGLVFNYRWTSGEMLEMTAMTQPGQLYSLSCLAANEGWACTPGKGAQPHGWGRLAWPGQDRGMGCVTFLLVGRDRQLSQDFSSLTCFFHRGLYSFSVVLQTVSYTEAFVLLL